MGLWESNMSSKGAKQWNIIKKMGRWALWGFGKILTKCVSLCHLSQPPSSQAPWLHEDYKCFMSVCLKPTASIWLPLSPFIPESQWSTTGPLQARGPGVGAGTRRRRECCSWSVLQIAFLIQADTVCERERVNMGGVFLWVYNRVGAGRHAFVSSRYRVLFERWHRLVVSPWRKHHAVSEDEHARLLAYTRACSLQRLAIMLNERSWERAERVWSQTCSHACLMKWG